MAIVVEATQFLQKMFSLRRCALGQIQCSQQAQSTGCLVVSSNESTYTTESSNLSFVGSNMSIYISFKSYQNKAATINN